MKPTVWADIARWFSPGVLAFFITCTRHSHVGRKDVLSTGRRSHAKESVKQ